MALCAKCGALVDPFKPTHGCRELDATTVRAEVAQQNALRALWRRNALEEAATICDEQAVLMDGRIPSAHGGMFAKKLAANALRGTAALIRQKIRET